MAFATEISLLQSENTYRVYVKKTKLGFTLCEISSERVAGKVRNGVNNFERERESELWRNGIWGKKTQNR